jgi:hypothetical protein
MDARPANGMNGKGTSHCDHFVLPLHLAQKVTEHADTIRVAAPSEKFDAFKLFARQVFGLDEAEYPLCEKVDRLQATAEAYGFVERLGSDAVQRALAEARADPLIEDEFSPRLDATLPQITKQDVVLLQRRDVLLSRCAAVIVPEKIEWVWPGRLARGKHTCAAGEPGGGKSHLASTVLGSPNFSSILPSSTTTPLTCKPAFSACLISVLSDGVRRQPLLPRDIARDLPCVFARGTGATQIAEIPGILRIACTVSSSNSIIANTYNSTRDAAPEPTRAGKKAQGPRAMRTEIETVGPARAPKRITL